MANLTSTTITGNANVTAEVNVATFAGDAGKTSNLAAGNIASGTLSTDRLPTVPTTKGGTGLTSIGSAGQVLKVAAPGSALEFGDAGGGGGYTKTIYTSPATYTPPASLKALRVTVYGKGGNGGSGNATSFSGAGGGGGGISLEVIQAPSIPGPVSITAGPGTNSFGSFLSATAGGNGGNAPAGTGSSAPGPAGSGSGGNENYTGSIGEFIQASGANSQTAGGEAAFLAKTYGYGNGGKIYKGNPNIGTKTPKNATGYGNGGGGGQGNGPDQPGGTGSPGAVIVEEFL